jgi:hypothetical protein
MASLSEFMDLLSTNLTKAMADYIVINHTESLDGDVMNLQACSERDVVFEFEGPNKIMIRAKKDSEKADQTLWYLPWVYNSLSKADLDGTGSAYFSTSLLTGCRFTVQFHDKSRKKATVMHLAGTLGTGTKQGTEARDLLEKAALDDLGKTVNVEKTLRRRYSFRVQKIRKIDDGETLYYGGNMAWIFGARGSDGAWNFIAQEMDSFADITGKGVKELT